MSTIYIISDFGKLVKHGNVLQLKKEDDVLKTIFPFKTEQIVVIGKIDLTGSALRLLMHENTRHNYLIRIFQQPNPLYIAIMYIKNRERHLHCPSEAFLTCN